MKSTVEMIVKALVDDADSVEVTEVERNRSTVQIEVRVAQPDVGKVIGRNGKTIRSLQTLLNAAGSKTKRRYTIEILE